MDVGSVQARVTITVLKTRNLPKPAANERRNVFCTMSLVNDSSDTVNTTTKTDSVNPVWEQSFTLNVKYPFAKVEICVYNAEPRQLLGKALVDVVTLADQAPHEDWHRISASKETGELQLRLQYKYVAEWDLLYRGPRDVLGKSYHTAINALTEAINKYPNYHELLLYRSTAYLELRELKRALTDSFLLVDMMPNNTLGYVSVGRVFLSAGEAGRAFEYFNQGLKINPHDEGILREMERMRKQRLKEVFEGLLAQNSGNPAVAVKNFTLAIEANPTNPQYLYYRAVALLSLHKHPEATADGMKILEISPEWPRQHASKEGWLQKAGKINISLKKRWFILAKCFLYYFKNQKDAKAQGVICLADFEVKSSASVPKKFSLEVPRRVWKFEALTAQEGTDWCTVLEHLQRGNSLVLEKDPEAAHLEEVSQRQRSITAAPKPAAATPAVSPPMTTRSFTDVTEGEPKTSSSLPKPSTSAHSLGLDSALRAAEALVTPPPAEPRTEEALERVNRSSIRQDQISSSESRYFQRFGLLPPMDGEMQSPVRSSDEPSSPPSETTSLLSKSTPGSPQKTSRKTTGAATATGGPSTEDSSACSCCCIC